MENKKKDKTSTWDTTRQISESAFSKKILLEVQKRLDSEHDFMTSLLKELLKRKNNKLKGENETTIKTRKL